MRRIKHKHTRRAVRFYKVQHGFRTPFKVSVYHADTLAKRLLQPSKCRSGFIKL